MRQTNTPWRDPRHLHYYEQTYAQQAGEVVGYWKAILATLFQRRMLQARPRQGGPVVPEADAYLFADRCLFVLDMHRLGGIPREEWLKHELWAQFRAAMKGRRVFVSDGGGLAITVAREPGEPERKRLPEQVPLDLTCLPEEPYHILLGQSRRGPIVLDLEVRHRAMLVAGTSGAGKTNQMQSVVLQLTRKHAPAEFQVAIVDTEEVDFAGFSWLPHLFAPVANELRGAAALIESVEQERLRRKAVMARAGAAKWTHLPDSEAFPLLLLVVDEAADFQNSAAMDTLITIARKGRKVGISLLLGTQHPTSDVISSQVKANLPTRLAFQTATHTESSTILGKGGAEKLNRPGLCLGFLNGRWETVQTVLVDEETRRRALDVSGVPSRDALSDVEVGLVRFALDELDGCFTINPLYSAFKGRISKPRLTKLGQQWESRGWLTPPAHRADPRRVTADLVQLLPPTPEPELTGTLTRGTRADTGSGKLTGRPGEADTAPDWAVTRASGVPAVVDTGLVPISD